MRGGSPKTLGAVASGLQDRVQHAAGTPTPAPSRGQLQPAPAPRGNGGEGASPSQKDSLGERLAAWANTWGDSKDDAVLDSLIAEARKVGWIR